MAAGTLVCAPDAGRYLGLWSAGVMTCSTAGPEPPGTVWESS